MLVHCVSGKSQEHATLTIKIPHRNPHTSLHIRTRCHRAIVIRNLLRLCRRIRWQIQPHIQLRNRHIDPQRHKRIHVSLLVRLARRLANDKVRLEPDAVDLAPAVLQLRDKALGGGGLVARILDVVVVVVQFDAQVVRLDGLRGGFEGEEEVRGPNGVVPDVGLPRAGGGVTEGLVDDVPRVAPVAKVGDEVGDVVDENGAEGLVGPVGGWGGQPGRELVVPD